jgi:hypothetical protein
MRGIYPRIETRIGLAERDPSPVSPLRGEPPSPTRGEGKKERRVVNC